MTEITACRSRSSVIETRSVNGVRLQISSGALVQLSIGAADCLCCVTVPLEFSTLPWGGHVLSSVTFKAYTPC
jgi:hypothetical protein